MPMITFPPSKRIRDFAILQCFAAKSAMRPLIVALAALAAIPFRSVPDEAAVGDVLGTLPVVVAVMCTLSAAMPNSSATTCAILM